MEVMREHFVKRVKKVEGGITLIELVIVIAVTGILIGALTPFFKLNVESYINIRAGKDMLQSARIGFNRMVEELKRVEDSVDISNGSSNSIAFYNADGNHVTYRYYYGQLQRGGVKLVDDVQSFAIRYYTADGTQKSTPFYYVSDVWRIEVEMEVGDGEIQLLFEDQVTPRNFHFD